MIDGAETDMDRQPPVDIKGLMDFFFFFLPAQAAQWDLSLELLADPAPEKKN